MSFALETRRLPGLRSVIWTGISVRIALILYAEIHDRLFRVKYTDIDYTVFQGTFLLPLTPYSSPLFTFDHPEQPRRSALTLLWKQLPNIDAAQHVLNGGSPFDRAEYRYTPLVAYLVLPNLLLHPTAGKWLFAASDIAVAYMVHELTDADSKALGPLAAALWLFNPFTATISTRGSMESAYLLTLFASMLLLKHKRTALAAIAFGLAVHWRLYPIIYIVPILLHLYVAFGSKPAPRRLRLLPLDLPALLRVLTFSIISGATFVLLSLAFYALYGQTYLDEYLFYHAARQDPKHNFSPYFYPLQLAASVAARAPAVARWTAAASGLAFVPQLGACVLIGVRFFRALPLAFLLQTVAFVAFNKVCTAQYFVWYLALVPICLPWLRPTRELLGAAAGWVAAVLHWLFWAYLLEFQELPVAAFVWLASLAFLGAHMVLLVAFVRSRRRKAGE